MAARTRHSVAMAAALLLVLHATVLTAGNVPRQRFSRSSPTIELPPCSVLTAAINMQQWVDLSHSQPGQHLNSATSCYVSPRRSC
jgi:hypothetical protein